MARKPKPTESAMPAVTATPQPIDANLLRQAMLDARVSSDVTQGVFGFLSDIQQAYNALLEQQATSEPLSGEETV